MTTDDPSNVPGLSPDDVEHAFYNALQSANLAQLMACWADEDDVVCTLPGGGRLVGIEAIRNAFESVLENGPVHVTPHGVHKWSTLTSAVFTSAVQLKVKTPRGEGEAWLQSTHVFHKTPLGWRLVAQHTSPGDEAERDPEPTRHHVLH